MLMTTRANLILVFVTFVWGITFPLIYIAVHHIDASEFVLLRFALSSLLLLPLVRKEFRHHSNEILWLCALLGLANFFTYSCQTIGLEYIEPTQSAFITGLNVVIVPFIAPFFKQGRTRMIDIICALLCLTGLYFLTGANVTNISYGEIITLGCAFFYAASIILLQIISKKTTHYKLVTFYQILFTALFALPFISHLEFNKIIAPSILLPLLFCAVIATILVLFLQVRYQQYTTPNKAALIYSLEPVFASIISYFFIRSHFSLTMGIGALIMMSGIILPDAKNLILDHFNPKITPP